MIFFKETPIRYYSLSRLFFVLVKKGKLCLPELGRMDWQRLAKLRNENTHGESDSEVDESTCREYIDTVKEIVRLNSKN